MPTPFFVVSIVVITISKKNLCVAAFNLIEGIDVPAIEEKIAKYQEENAEQIMINRARKVFKKLPLLASF